MCFQTTRKLNYLKNKYIDNAGLGFFMAVWAGSHSSWERAGRSKLDFVESQARSMACTWTHTPTQSCLYIWKSHLCPAGLPNLDICNYISLKEGVAISVTAHINHKYPACMHLWIVRKVNGHFFCIRRRFHCDCIHHCLHGLVSVDSYELQYIATILWQIFGNSTAYILRM